MSSIDGSPRTTLHSSHWGVFDPFVVDGRIVDVRLFPKDPDPSPIIHSIPDAVYHPCRVAQPFVREGWLTHGPGGGRSGRGGGRFVSVSWDRALDLVEQELKRVVATHGNEAIFGGSYGWSSAGRFHHAKTQLQRFLVRIGGFTSSKDTYSNAAGTVLVKRVVGDAGAVAGGPSWQSILCGIL